MVGATAPAPPLLNLELLPAFLLDRQLVEPWDLVHGGFRAEHRARRNRSFKVRATRTRPLLVKQADTLTDPSTARTVRLEAELLRAIGEEDALAPLRWCAPTFVDYDRVRGVCTTALVDPSTTLTRYHQGPRERPAFPAEPATTAARILADVHDVGGRALAEGILPSVARSTHYMLTHHAQLQTLGPDASPALKGLVRHVRERTTWPARAAEIPALWEGHADLVHGDARWENYLLGTQEPPGRVAMDMRLIDWELAVAGDGAFDVATWFAEYFRFWTQSARAMRPTGLDDLAARAALEPARWHAQARVFWQAYARRRGLRASTRAAFLARVLRYLPPLLVIAATEGCKAQLDYPGTSAALVELSERFHVDARGSTARYLGLRAPAEAA